MYSSELPDLISDIKDIKLNKKKPSLSKLINKIPERFSVQNLLQRCGETNTQLVYTMDLRCEKLDNIPTLKEFRHLKILDVSSNSIKNLENLQYVNELKELKVFDNQLINLSNLNNLKELIVLQAQYNHITNLNPNVLISCRKLKQIRLDNNCINQLTLRDFSSCANLNYVDVSFNNIQSLSFIACLPNLEELYASNNKIEIIPDLSRCKKLSEIRLNNNLITNINGIKEHKTLSILDLSNNNITSLSNLGILEKIEYLNVANNHIPIDHLEYLKSSFPNLEILNVNNNDLSDVKKLLVYVSCLSNLCELSMQDNPFPIINEDTNEQYNYSMIQCQIPNIKMLDNILLKRSDHQNAMNNNPLPMRPLTAAAGISLRQIDNQLTSFSNSINEMQSQNKSCYNNIVQLLLESKESNNNFENSPSEVQQSTQSPTIHKMIRKSRLVDALVFASVNYTS